MPVMSLYWAFRASIFEIRPLLPSNVARLSEVTDDRTVFSSENRWESWSGLRRHIALRGQSGRNQYSANLC